MFKIGEFSKLTQVSIRMLRYYDEAGLLKPARIDPVSGYRLYEAVQIPVLNRIIFLRDFGFHISEIKDALDRWDSAFITKQLDKKREEISQTIEKEKAKLRKLEAAKEDILNETIEVHCNVIVKEIPSYHVFSLRRVIPDYYGEGELWKEMAEFASQNQIPISENTFTIYHDLEYKETKVDVEVCAFTTMTGEDSRDGFKFRHTEAVPLMASTMVYGGFENIAQAYVAFANWLEENSQYKMTGQSRQIVHRGPWNEDDPKNYLAEIQAPIKKIS